MIRIDLQEAFDTINHEVLLPKLKVIRFSEQSIQWFRSSLCDQMLSVETENKLSDLGKISCGVPQGSILGPFLFLIYITDMPQAVKSNWFLYAHDSWWYSKHFDIISTLFLGWYHVAKSHNIKLTLEQRCVRQCGNLQRSATLKQRCVFQRCITSKQCCHLQRRFWQRWAM